MRSLLSDMLADALRRGRRFCSLCDWRRVVCLRLQAERELHLIYRNPSGLIKGFQLLQKAVAVTSQISPQDCHSASVWHSAVEDMLCNLLGIVLEVPATK